MMVYILNLLPKEEVNKQVNIHIKLIYKLHMLNLEILTEAVHY